MCITELAAKTTTAAASMGSQSDAIDTMTSSLCFVE